MRTDPQTKCATCGASYSYVAQGKRDYFIPWGDYFLCDECHRLVVMEVIKTEIEPPIEPPK